MAKRGQGEGTISKRPDGTWWARITVGRTPDGKQKRKAFYGKTREEVKNKLIAALNEINGGTYIEPSKMTVGQWLDIWVHEYKERYVKLSTYNNLCSVIEIHIKPNLGACKITELRGDMVQKLVNDSIDKGLGASRVRRVATVLNSALKQAYVDGIINRIPTDQIILPKYEKSEMRVLTQEEQNEFVRIAKTVDYGSAFILALGTGLRLGELLGLQWEDIDFQKSTLSVNRIQIRTRRYNADFDENKDNKLGYGTPKTKKSIRVIPLLPGLVNLLKTIKEEQEKNKKIYGDLYQENHLVFCKDDGKAVWPTYLDRMFKHIVTIMGIDGLHIHCLRHTFATRGLESGIELRVMQELLGHATINMTANLYTHVLSDKKQDSINKLTSTLKL